MDHGGRAGPARRMRGPLGPWMLWRRPGTGLPALLVHTHDNGEMSLEVLPSDADADADAVGQAHSRGALAHLPASRGPL